MDKLEIKWGSFIQQTQYFIPVGIDLSVVPARLGIWCFHLSRRTTYKIYLSDVSFHWYRTNVNVEVWSHHLSFGHLNTHLIIDPNIEKLKKDNILDAIKLFRNFLHLSYMVKIALKRLEWRSENLAGNTILVVILVWKVPKVSEHIVEIGKRFS
jgi:hypothetical protein